MHHSMNNPGLRSETSQLPVPIIPNVTAAGSSATVIPSQRMNFFIIISLCIISVKVKYTVSSVAVG